MARRNLSLFPAVYERRLYAVGLKDGRIKIGQTRTPRERLRHHRQTFGADQIAWMHLGGSLPNNGHACHWEGLVIKELASIGERIGRTEVFRGIDKTTALAVMRAIVLEQRTRYEAWRTAERTELAWMRFRALHVPPPATIAPATASAGEG